MHLRIFTVMTLVLSTTLTYSSTGLPISASTDWNTVNAAHLLRRAGFGGTPEQILALAAMGRDAAVDFLIDYDAIDPNDPPYPRGIRFQWPSSGIYNSLTDVQKKYFSDEYNRINRLHTNNIRYWWLRRMAITNRPLEEKMTLFWHNLLTSEFSKVGDWQMMVDQNAFLRQNALGDFETILQGISRDPAMLRYLDNYTNRRDHPNENYARELMELFTMGVGHFTELDVREAARAFSGWGLADDGSFRFVPERHDPYTKYFLENIGDFDGDDIIGIILEQEATARHLAQALWEFFAYPDPEEAIIADLADDLRDSGYDFRFAMRQLLRSDAFYSERARLAQIKCPTELVVGLIRSLEIEPGDYEWMFWAMGDMGQELYQPPNVKGWLGGLRWINTNTLLNRYNFGVKLLHGTSERPSTNGLLATANSQVYGPPEAVELSPSELKRQESTAAMNAFNIQAFLDTRWEEPAFFTSLMLPVLIAPTDNSQGTSALLMTAVSNQGEEPSGEVTLPDELQALLVEPPDYKQPQYGILPMTFVDRYGLRTRRDVVAHFIHRLLAMDLPDEKVELLQNVLLAGNPIFDIEDRETTEQAIFNLLELMVAMPEMQIN